VIATARADVVINELVAGASDRLLQWDANGVPQVGTGPRWYQASYNDAAWQTGPGPFGFAANAATNLQTAMRYLTPTTYFRKKFTVSELAGDQAQLAVEYNDGFVAFLNGVEVARRNGGPAKKWIYHDQPAFNREVFGNATASIPAGNLVEVINLGAVVDRLVAGENILAIHLLNASATDGSLFLKADLRVTGAQPLTLVNFNDPWKYFPGVVEPSGNLFDPGQLDSGRQHILWGTLDFDVAGWSSGPGPFGFGNVGAVGTDVQAAMQNITPALYARAVFEVTPAQAADPLPLKLTVSNDDAFVAYLNGVEVARRRLGAPNTFTPHDAVADFETASPFTETLTLAAASKLLVAGTNVLAIQAHNFTASNADFLLKASLATTAGEPLVVSQATFQFLPGTAEPVRPATESEEDPSFPEGPDSDADWIELHNTGAQPISLAGWSLTDDPAAPAKWRFPEVEVPAGGYLVVIADGKEPTGPASGFLHTNFSLDRDGEYVGLRDASGALVSEIAPGFPRQTPFHSYERDAGGAYRYSDLPTPGAANSGTFYNGIVEPPTADLPGRFYTGQQTVTLSSPTPGAIVRYTLDGKEPSPSSTVATGPLPIASNAVLRARAFAEGSVPSETITHTYLINQSANRRSLPAVCLSADPQQVFYRPFGVLAIVNNSANNYVAGIWSNHPNATRLNPPDTPEDPLQYNMPMQSGRPAERPLSLEVLHTDATPDLRTGSHLRVAGSPYSRPRYRLNAQNSANPNASAWAISDVEKPQLNLFFRDDIGQRPLPYPFIRGSVVREYDDIRLRAGKNELGNPFVRDEFSRRAMLEMGHVTVLGDFVNVYVNASFKGYYNICERPREPFFQQARSTKARFDVRNIDSMADGDTLAVNELLRYARTASISTNAGYEGLRTRMDVLNFADYILLNTYGGTWDWPQNNYVMDRERSPAGVFRFSVWDAEGAFGLTGRNPNTWNQFTGGDLSVPLNSLNVATEQVPAVLFYTVLKQNAEWRLLFADRIRKHLFNGGPLTAERMNARFVQLKTVMEPMLKEFGGAGVVMVDFATPWGNPRKTAYLPQARAQGLWPDTQAPEFSQFGGNMPADFRLTITNPNSTGTIFYTTNGEDPRAAGGAAAGIVYDGTPLAFSQTALVRARVRISDTSWSPMTEATFIAPTPAPLIISEIMYRPSAEGAVSGDEFEFAEVKNVGGSAVSLAGMRFSDGIDFAFSSNAAIPAGRFAVLARNSAQFAARYPNVPVIGSFGTSSALANGGETVRLVDVSGATVFAVTYANSGAWPAAANGAGKSLVPRNRNNFTDPNDAAQWRASIAVHGSPGADDDRTFAEWQTAHFTPEQLNDPNVSGAAADADSDGMTTFEEFALGLDPHVSDSKDAVTSELTPDGAGGAYLTLSYRRNLGAAGVAYHVDTAAAPGAWTLDASQPVGTPIDNGDGTWTETRRDLETTSSAAQRFIRLRIVAE